MTDHQHRSANAAATHERQQEVNDDVNEAKAPTKESGPAGGIAGMLRERPTLRSVALRFGMVWVLIALAIFASSLYDGFFTFGNLNNLVSQVAPTGIVAVGMTFAIISGQFDLSATAVFAGSAVVYATLSNDMPLLPAFLLTIVVGSLGGIINGLIVTRLKVNTFIATLGTASLFSGLTYLYSDATPIISEADGFGFLGSEQTLGIWNSVWVLVILVVVLGIVLAKTPYGRSVYAVGGNMEAARLAGMRVDVIRISTFTIVAACGALSGMIVASQTGVGQANIGPTLTLDAIAIVIIGGTSLMGGEGAMWRTVIGILLWGTIGNVFASLALDTSSQLIIQGSILLVAVGIDSLVRMSRP